MRATKNRPPNQNVIMIAILQFVAAGKSCLFVKIVILSLSFLVFNA